ncbi:Serine protease 53 [Manis javanica]|nr:Serine protease 53 [Manis javanica]
MRLDKAGLLQNSGRKVTNMQTECKTIPGTEAIYVLMVREALVSQDIWDQSKLRGVQDRRQTPEEWRIGLGAGPEERGLKKLILHGAYTHLEGGYDVALLLLAQPMTLGPSLQPLCLPYADHYLPDGEHGWILGLAQGADTSFPQTVPVTLLEPRACSRLHATLESDGIPILPGMVCTSVVALPTYENWVSSLDWQFYFAEEPEPETGSCLANMSKTGGC